MNFAKRRTRLVSFRICEQDYQRLRTVCATIGARSISELARSALGRLVGFGPEAAGDSGGIQVSSQIWVLTQAMQELRQTVEHLTSKVAAVEASSAGYYHQLGDLSPQRMSSEQQQLR